MGQQGELLHRGTVRCRELRPEGGTLGRRSIRGNSLKVRKKSGNSKMEPAHIFLFKQRSSDFGTQDFHLWHKFLINMLTLRDVAGDSELEFELHERVTGDSLSIGQLSDTVNIDRGTGVNIAVCAQTREEKDKWVSSIQSEIHALKELANNLTRPSGGTRLARSTRLKTEEGTKDSSMARRERGWSKE